MFPSKRALKAAGKEATKELYGTSVAQTTWTNRPDQVVPPKVENMNDVLHMGNVFNDHMKVRCTAAMPLRPKPESRVEYFWKGILDSEMNRSMYELTRERANHGTNGPAVRLPEIPLKSQNAAAYTDLTPKQTRQARRQAFSHSQHAMGTALCPGDHFTCFSCSHAVNEAAQSSVRPGRGMSYSGPRWRPPTNTHRPQAHAPDALKSLNRADFTPPFGQMPRKGVPKSASTPSGLLAKDSMSCAAMR